MLIIIGYWNAKAGKKVEPNVVGKFGLGDRNETGEGLIEFYKGNNLFMLQITSQMAVHGDH